MSSTREAGREKKGVDSSSFRFARVPDRLDIGVFATRDIRIGEILLEEEPILTATMATLSHNVARLDDTSRRRLFSLCDWRAARSQQSKSALGIFQANGYPCDNDEAGVFFRFSRFNHSCTPNASHIWRAGKRYVFSTRDISKGEEICTNYIDITNDRQKRQYLLQEHFGFVCHCQACSGKTQDQLKLSDARRSEINTLDQCIYDHVRFGRYEKAIQDAEKRISLLRAEDLDSPPQLVRTAHDALQAMEGASNQQGTIDWLRFLLDQTRLCEPSHSPDISQLENKLASLLMRKEKNISTRSASSISTEEDNISKPS